MKNAQLDLALFQASAVDVHGSKVVESSAPPFGMKVCSMNRVDSYRPISPLKMKAMPVSVYWWIDSSEFLNVQCDVGCEMQR